MTVNLTTNAISIICNGVFEENGFKPIVQVIGLKLLRSQQASYGLLLSDGIHTQQGMLATKMNNLITSGKLQAGSVIQLFEFVSQTIQNQKILIVISMHVILDKCDQIGQPKHYYMQGAAGSAPLAQPAMGKLGMAAGAAGSVQQAQPAMWKLGMASAGAAGSAPLSQPAMGKLGMAAGAAGSVQQAQLLMGKPGMASAGAAPLSQPAMGKLGMAAGAAGSVQQAQSLMGKPGIAARTAGSAPQAQPPMQQPGMAAGNYQQSYAASASVPSGLSATQQGGVLWTQQQQLDSLESQRRLMASTREGMLLNQIEELKEENKRLREDTEKLKNALSVLIK